MAKIPKLGLIARADDSGLGRLSQDFFNHLPIHKVMIVYNNIYDIYPERYPDDSLICRRGKPDLEEIDVFLRDIDIVLTFETPYNWNLFSEAHKRGIKTVLIPNYEWTPQTLPVVPDLMICPSQLDYDEMKYNTMGVNEVIHLPIPVDREKFPFKLRKKAEVFVFNNGHGGHLERNSWHELFQAISLVKKEAKFLIRSQVYFPYVINDSRIKIEYGDLPQDKLFSEGDVYIWPHKFDGLSLPIQEALSSGMPVISTNIYPHNTYLPKDWLFEPESISKVFVRREIDYAIISPKILAEKIEEWIGRDIEKDSKKANEIAEQWSWEKLTPKYLKVLQDLCQK